MKGYVVQSDCTNGAHECYQCINSELELKEFRDMLAQYFAKKAQKAIDALWDEGVISSDTIEEWGEEHMRTPYHYETNRP